LLVGVQISSFCNISHAQEVSADPSEQTLYIREYRVIGTKRLPRETVEEAVYEYMGPERTTSDVEAAREALERAYKKEGYETVTVSVPQQRGTRGIVFLHVTEAPVGRLRVTGSRYFDIERIKKRAKSLAEGTVPNFNDVKRDLIALNRKPDLRVTPEFRPGALPGTVDVDLVVEDTFPLHGALELNNRYSENTTPLRLDLTVRYDNLWQWGHTIGFGFQVAPQRPSDAIVYSGYYVAPVPGLDWLSVMGQAIRQNSNVSTLGGTATAGNGVVFGGRFLFDLPGAPGFFQTASLGMDYKRFDQDIDFGNEVIEAPITYFPVVASYSGFWMGEDYQIEFDGAINFSFRGIGSDEIEFDNRRFGADGNFFYFRGSLSGQYDLPLDFQIFALVQGQASGVPLVDSEQFALGGLNTVRGYLESQVLGDSAIASTLEIRSPSLLYGMDPLKNEWRIFGFIDGGAAWLNQPLPEQQSEFTLWSVGVGTNVRLFEHLNGALYVGFPQISQGTRLAGQPLFTFRVWGDL